MFLKKRLPFVLLGLGILVFVGTFIFTKVNVIKDVNLINDGKVAEIPLEKRPVVSLIPIKEGRFLKLRIEKMDLRATTLDYELLYDVPGGVTQGVPGSVNIKGLSSFETEILLGSESSGKFRYDEGVEQGTITVRFRDDKGKLMAKFTSDFRMQSNVDLISSIDDNFIIKFDKPVKDTVVVMHTIGSKSKLPPEILHGPYGVFSENSLEFLADVSVKNASKIYYDQDSYKEVSQTTRFKTPVFFVAK
ncbi:MAG: hypothetical protein NZM26_03330 [Patescibacteria group bacterium]|nr:hypothetical protein [Patescibacteria group bacterium]